MVLTSPGHSEEHILSGVSYTYTHTYVVVCLSITSLTLHQSTLIHKAVKLV